MTSNDISASSTYKSASHGVFLRNAHAQEVLMRAENIAWRTIGGSIDLFFFNRPSQPEVTKQHQLGAIDASNATVLLFRLPSVQMALPKLDPTTKAFPPMRQPFR